MEQFWQAGEAETFLLFFVTQIAFYLYGPGLRRPLFSLRTVKNIPVHLAEMPYVFIVLDTIFFIVMVSLWISFYQEISNLPIFFLGFLIFTFVGKHAADRIAIIPSFFIAWGVIVSVVFELEKLGKFSNFFL